MPPAPRSPRSSTNYADGRWVQGLRHGHRRGSQAPAGPPGGSVRTARRAARHGSASRPRTSVACRRPESLASRLPDRSAARRRGRGRGRPGRGRDRRRRAGGAVAGRRRPRLHPVRVATTRPASSRRPARRRPRSSWPSTSVVGSRPGLMRTLAELTPGSGASSERLGARGRRPALSRPPTAASSVPSVGPVGPDRHRSAFGASLFDDRFGLADRSARRS